MDLTVILLLAGKGTRFGDDLPKQYQNLSGKPIYLHTLECFIELPYVSEILLVASREYLESIKSAITFYQKKYRKTEIRVIQGGDSRQASSYQGILHAKHSNVMIHDGVRPFLTETIIENNIKALKRYNAIDTCIKASDTIVRTQNQKEIAEIPNRDEFYQGQTPQTFKRESILKAHTKALENLIFNATDDCQLAHLLGETVNIVEGHPSNIKITTQLDLFLAENLLRLKKTKLTPSQKNSLKNKNYVVTGATGGIGEQIVKLLKSYGANVFELSRSSKTYPVDLTSFFETKKIFAKLHQKTRAFDGLINCAGKLFQAPLKTLPPHQQELLIKSNFSTIIHPFQEVNLKPKAHVVNLASSSYSKGRKNYVLYSAMKAAVVNLTQGLSEEHPELYINTIVPPRTSTPMRWENFPEENKNSLMDPLRVAEEVIKLLQTEGVTGSIIEIDR